jgi:hypothetical protein
MKTKELTQQYPDNYDGSTFVKSKSGFEEGEMEEERS